MAKRVFSAAAPSGDLTLGNYIGAIKNWVKMQDEAECIYSIVDLHAITIRQESKELRKKTLDFVAQYIAAGIDPKRATFFIQSHVSAHSELTWLLNCNTYIGELSRMTQFKSKGETQAQVSVGLLDYPVLMAADILLYDIDTVPVGEDQIQHVEIARDIATRFNHFYGPTFVVPAHFVPKAGARVMSLVDTDKKMSKSDKNMKNKILLIEEDEDIRSKISKATTDSLGHIKFCEEQPGISNLITIYSVCKGVSIEAVEKEFAGKNYGDFKRAVAEAVVSVIAPIRERYKKLRSDEAALIKICNEGAKKARLIADKKLKEVQCRIGFVVE